MTLEIDNVHILISALASSITTYDYIMPSLLEKKQLVAAQLRGKKPDKYNLKYFKEKI